MADGAQYPKIDQTAHYEFFAQALLGQPAIDVVGALKLSCEQDFSTVRAMFGRGDAPGLPFAVIIDDGDDGANHNGCADTEIHVGLNATLRASNPPQKMVEIYRLLLIAEVVEVFEAMTPDWNCAHSPGEGLSRVLAYVCHPGGEFNATAGEWLDQNPRPNWIDQTDPEDSEDISVGCAALFLNWLRYVKAYSWLQITSARGGTLAEVYRHLTGNNDAWATFSAEMAARWPVGIPSGVKTDQPFP
jgi:hypothetical protein